MRTFENEDGAFVELFAEGPRIHHRWGRIDGSAFSRIATFPDPEQAALSFRLQVRRLTRHYQPGAVQKQMLDAMHAAPKEPAPFLVYADWLQQLGDPHGELITRTPTRREAESLVGEDAPHFFPHTIAGATYFWELGFIVRAEISGRYPAPIHQLFLHPLAAFIREVALVDAPQYQTDNWPRLFTVDAPATLERIEVPKAGPFAALALEVPIIVPV